MRRYRSIDGELDTNGADSIIMNDGRGYPAGWFALQSDDDLAEHGFEAYDAPDELPPPPAIISDRQFFHGLTKEPFDLLTRQEAMKAVKVGDVPAALMAIITGPMVAALLPPSMDAFDVEILVAGATTFDRYHPITEILIAAFGWTAEDGDNFWRFASQL